MKQFLEEQTQAGEQGEEQLPAVGNSKLRRIRDKLNKERASVTAGVKHH